MTTKSTASVEDVARGVEVRRDSAGHALHAQDLAYECSCSWWTELLDLGAQRCTP